MELSFKYQNINKNSSFKAWGAGLSYEYDAPEGVLDIIHTSKNTPIIFIRIPEETPGHALLYARYLEKAIQVNSLVLSKNTTVDITKIMNRQKFPAIIQRMSTLADYSFDLSTGALGQFTKNFKNEFSLKNMKIKTINGINNRTKFFNISIRTQENNRVVARGQNLYSAMSSLSEQVLQELLISKLEKTQDSDVQNLLKVSSNLLTISKILDTKFLPNQHLTSNNT